MPKHGSIRKVYACLAVTCHLHFWQNDRDFLRATVVTRGWNGYRNKSQHRKSTLEKKILPPFQQGFEPATFQSRVRRSNHWAIPAPKFFGCASLSLIDCLVSEDVTLSQMTWWGLCQRRCLYDGNGLVYLPFAVSGSVLSAYWVAWQAPTPQPPCRWRLGALAVVFVAGLGVAVWWGGRGVRTLSCLFYGFNSTSTHGTGRNNLLAVNIHHCRTCNALTEPNPWQEEEGGDGGGGVAVARDKADRVPLELVCRCQSHWTIFQ